MRLINVHSLELEEFFDNDIKPYAILSHTWGDKEVSFQEWTDMRRLKIDSYFGNFSSFLEEDEIDRIKSKSGYSKVRSFCKKVEGWSTPFNVNCHYAWVDTCCINKESSTELSEAINSMYRWYKNAEVCFVYLEDVPAGDKLRHEGSRFSQSRWFTRGWTLQELLAPKDVRFFDASWGYVGSRTKLQDHIPRITGIPHEYLVASNGRRRDVHTAPMAMRMSWASKRETSRNEDTAYCLMGIFGINMSLLYGEGDKAFIRLQEEILKQTGDQSLLAWGFGGAIPANHAGLLGTSPKDFTYCADVKPTVSETSNVPFQMTNMGLQIRLKLWIQLRDSSLIYAVLNCVVGKKVLLVALKPLHPGLVKDGDVFCRFHDALPFTARFPQRTDWNEDTRTICIQRSPVAPEIKDSHKATYLDRGLRLREVHPPDTLRFIDNSIFARQRSHYFLRVTSVKPSLDLVLMVYDDGYTVRVAHTELPALCSIAELHLHAPTLLLRRFHENDS